MKKKKAGDVGFPFPAINSVSVVIKQQTEGIQCVLTKQFSPFRYK